MGRPRIKTIDDSAKEEVSRVEQVPQVEEKKQEEKPRDTRDTSKTRGTLKPGKAKPRSKKYQEIAKDLDRTKAYSLDEAVNMVKKLSYSKFNGTLEAHINTAQTGIRGLVSLPYVKAVESFQAGKTEYKTEPKAPIIHIALGKLNQPNEELVANIKTLLQTLGKTRVKKLTLSPTMGPGIKVDLASI